MSDTAASPRAGFIEKVDKTLRYHIRQMQHGWRDLRWQIARPQVRRPVFVVGCSRAGTTLVYKTFSVSPQLGSLNRETHDYWEALHPLPQRDWRSHVLSAELASQRDRDAVAHYFYRYTGQNRFVDKNNQNGLCVGYLLALFPDACFVYVKRSPGDNLNSLIEGWQRPGEFATWSHSLPAEVAIDGGTVRQWCFFLPEGWRDYLNASLEAVCAFQYRSMNTAILAGRDLVPASQWHEIRYEDLLSDPVAGFRAAYTACGLEFDPAVESHCRQVLSRPYNAFSRIALDKWRNSPHRERIEHVLPEVEDVARRMGYSSAEIGM